MLIYRFRFIEVYTVGGFKSEMQHLPLSNVRMMQSSALPKSYRQLQPGDHLTLVSVAQQKYSVRAMAQVLGRPERHQ